MATETAPSPVPATSKQSETIARLERATGIPKAQRQDASTMTRTQASAYIAELIARTQEDDDAPAPPTAPAAPAPQPTQEQIAQTRAAVAQLPGTRDETPRGEWPPVPPQSSEAQPQAQQPTVGANPVAVAQNRASDNPFAAPAGDTWEELGATMIGDEDDEIDLERSKLAPVGIPVGFQVITAEKKQVGPSGYPGILVTSKVVQAEEGVELGGTATEYISLSPGARWKLDQFLDACNAPVNGKINYRQFVGWTFWAQAKRDDYTKILDSGETQTTPKVVIDKYLEGPKIAAPTVSANGTAPREKVQAKLGEEFS